jgi:hypothetical protein
VLDSEGKKKGLTVEDENGECKGEGPKMMVTTLIIFTTELVSFHILDSRAGKI